MRILIFGLVVLLFFSVSACSDEPAQGDQSDTRREKLAVVEIVDGGPALSNFANGTKAYTNRKYVLQAIPDDTPFRQFTLLPGGGVNALDIEVIEPGMLYIAVSDEPGKLKEVGAYIQEGGWVPTAHQYAYSARGGTIMRVYQKQVPVGPMRIPRFNWSGPVVLLP